MTAIGITLFLGTPLKKPQVKVTRIVCTLEAMLGWCLGCPQVARCRRWLHGVWLAVYPTGVSRINTHSYHFAIFGRGKTLYRRSALSHNCLQSPHPLDISRFSTPVISYREFSLSPKS